MNTNTSTIVFHASAKDFKKIPGAPVAYWASEKSRDIFAKNIKLSAIAQTRDGLTTGDNDVYLRLWYEINYENIGFNIKSHDESILSAKRWFPYSKGGCFRKWYGNIEYVVNWENGGKAIRSSKKAFPRNKDFYFKEGITWTLLSSGNAFGSRLLPLGCIFDVNSKCAFANSPDNSISVLLFLTSSVAHLLVQVVNPTMAFQAGDIARLPIVIDRKNNKKHLFASAIEKCRSDWDIYEISWDFCMNPLLTDEAKVITHLQSAYANIRQHWTEMTEEMQRLEEENNRIFIEAYGLQDELTPDVPWNEITLTCNPWYRYGVTPANPTCKEFPVDDALEARMKADTMKEFLSYAVGCMFGRYSLDKPGLVLANQGETLADYLQQIPQPTFRPDEDNVLPILDEDWFADDIVTRFYEFLKTTFGEETFYENLAFIEDALGKDVRSFFLKDFYKDHLQRYHNRPIYWLFSSPKGAFNALVYMHRYRPETVGTVLTYLRSHITKVSERIHTLEITIDSPDATASMKSKAIRECAKLQKSLQELEDYERDVLYPLATEKIDLDLDDGVKVNYRKFGNALFKVKGLETKED